MAATQKKKVTGLSVSIKKKDDLGMWYQEVLTVSFNLCAFRIELHIAA